MTADVVSPTGRITAPMDGDTVPRGDYVLIEAHAWDNAALSLVEYRVDGKVVCSQSEALPSVGFVSPLYYCWWKVPRKITTHWIEVASFDASGNVHYSTPVAVYTN